MPNEQGSVELGFLSQIAAKDAAFRLLRPRCTYVNPKTSERCMQLANYEFELNPKYWPGAKPPIIQYACLEHGADARTLVGVMFIKTI